MKEKLKIKILLKNKLRLNKEIIAKLNTEQMNLINGGFPKNPKTETLCGTPCCVRC